MTRTVVAGALGDCAHVAGVYSFLRLAEAAGWRTAFLGPAVSIADFLSAVRREKKRLRRGDLLLVGVSYRLAPETGERQVAQFAAEAADLRSSGVRFVFGGTPPVAGRVRSLDFFEQVFDGNEPTWRLLAYLKGQPAPDVDPDQPQALIERIQSAAPYPLLAHRFGPHTVDAAADGISAIAQAEVLDSILLHTDPEAQENLFHAERRSGKSQADAGTAVRSRDDLGRLFEASRCGNFPLVQAAAGSDDFLRYAALLTGALPGSWCTTPLCWHNRLDGRGPWSLQASIREHQELMAWYAKRGIPVELDEPHHWGMRDASDVIFVVAGFLSAYNAKKCGVKDYVAEMVFGLPPGISDAMDLAKMEALLRLIEPLSAPDFRIWRQTSLSPICQPTNPAAARGHLAASTYLQMSVRPHICQAAGQAATAQEVIEAGRLMRSAVEAALGAPDMRCTDEVQQRTQLLMSEAVFTLEAIRDLCAPGTPDPWTDPTTLGRAVTSGVLDAPGLAGNPFAAGRIRTRLIHGGCDAVDRAGRPITERERLPPLL